MVRFIIDSILLGLGSTALGGVIGLIADHMLGTSPWLALAVSFIGLSTSFFLVQFSVLRIFSDTQH